MMTDTERATSALWSIPCPADYDSWFKLLCAAKAADVPEAEVISWCESGEGFKSAEFENKWKSIDAGIGIGAGSLFHKAKECGFDATGEPRPTRPIDKPSPSPTKPVKQAASLSPADVWERCIAATPAEPYVDRKGGRPDGLKVYPASAEKLTIAGVDMTGALVIPCWDGDKLQTMQFIPIKGDKKNLAGASFGDGFFVVGNLETADRVYICEGVGQAWAVTKADPASAAVVTFGSGRMARIAKVLRGKYPDAKLVLCPDRGKETDAAKVAADVAGQWIAMPDDKPGNYDANDFAQEHGTDALADLLQRAKSPPNQTDDDAFSLDAFVMNGTATKMEAQMLEDKFVLGRLAILGQSTLWYAPPNVGKTLLFLWLLIDAIKRGEIDPADVYFIDADDHHKGLIHKLKLAERHGFKLLAPSYNGFKPEKLAMILSAMVLQDKAHGKILILDTAKKFTDIMDKKKGSAFGESVRQFVMHGGTVISLAHTNKHRNEDGGLIYAGTSDLVDDCDAAYTLDEVSADKGTGIKTVKFTNFKARGDNALEAVYEYNFSEGMSYQKRLESVRSLSSEETTKAIKRKAMEERLERNREAVEAIKQCISNGVTKKTELIKAAMDLSALPKGKIATALKEHTGKSVADYQFWNVNVADKNAHVYQLNYGYF